MTALKKTFEATPDPTHWPKTSKKHIKIATADCEAVASGAHQLQFHLETTLSASAPEPVIEKWPPRVRMAIFAVSIVLPWSIIALAVKALVR